MKKLLLLILISFVFSAATRAQETTFVPVCAGTNDTGKFTSFIATIGANTGTIRLPYKAGTRCAVNNLTIPANVTLDNTDGTGIKVNTGQTLTISGPVSAPPKQLFHNAVSGQGTVKFAAGVSYLDTINLTQQDYWVEWWGAVGDNDNAKAVINPPALEAAFNAMPHGGTLHLAGRFYKINRGVVWSHKFQATVVGNESSVGYSDNFTKPILVYQGPNGGTALTLSNMYSSTFKGFGVYSNDGVNLANGADKGIYLTHSAGGYPALTSHCNLIAITSHSIHTRANWVGIDIGDLVGGNNEHHTIEDAHIVGGEDHTGTTQTGLRLGHPQVKAIVLRRSNISNVGVAVAISGNLRAYDNTYVACGTVYLGNYVTEATSIYGDDVESVTYIFRGLQQPGPGRIAFMGSRYANLYAAGTSLATAPVQTVGSISFYDCHFGALNGAVFGKYFVAGPNDGNYPPVKFVNSTWQFTPIVDMAEGFASCSTTIEEGRSFYQYGLSRFTIGEDQRFEAVPAGGATPQTFSARRTIFLPGSTHVNNFTAPFQDGLMIADGSIGFSGLFMPNKPSLTLVGTTGATIRRFTVVAVDSAGRRSLDYRNSGESFVGTTLANATLTGSNYIRLQWPAQYPTPDHFEVYEINPGDSAQWRFVSNVAVSGNANELYDVVTNPAGSFIATRPSWNESGFINVRNSMIFPNEVTLVSTDATPSVAIANDFVTANAGATTITNFDDGTTGQEIRIRINDANTTIQNNANIITGTGADIAAVNGAIYKFMRRAAAWRRVL